VKTQHSVFPKTSLYPSALVRAGRFACSASVLSLALCAPARAQQADNPSWWQQAKNKVSLIANEGQGELYLSGYAYHGRNTYTAERIAEFNEKDWGLGYGKSLYNAKGNEESLFFMTISDSHYKPQPMLGYAYQWMWPIAKSGIEIGAGYTAMVVNRADYFGGVPFPLVLPVASIGAKKFRRTASYIPRISNNKGNGDVLFLLFRTEL
jgi:hypothetical protein